MSLCGLHSIQNLLNAHPKWVFSALACFQVSHSISWEWAFLWLGLGPAWCPPNYSPSLKPSYDSGFSFHRYFPAVPDWIFCNCHPSRTPRKTPRLSMFWVVLAVWCQVPEILPVKTNITFRNKKSKKLNSVDQCFLVKEPEMKTILISSLFPTKKMNLRQFFSQELLFSENYNNNNLLCLHTLPLEYS